MISPITALLAGPPGIGKTSAGVSGQAAGAGVKSDAKHIEELRSWLAARADAIVGGVVEQEAS